MNKFYTTIFALFAFSILGHSQELNSIVDTLNNNITSTSEKPKDNPSGEKDIVELKQISESQGSSKTQTSRYFFNESAFGLKEGQSMYQNIMGIINTFSYGFTDNFTVNFTTELVSPFEGRFPIILISPKYTFGSIQSNIRFGLGANYAMSLSDSNEAIGSLYGLMSIGKPQNNITVGLGYLYSTDNGFEGQPIFQLSTSLLLKENLIFIFDANFAIDGEIIGVFSPTLRYLKDNATFDLSFTNISESNIGIVPLIGVSFLF